MNILNRQTAIQLQSKWLWRDESLISWPEWAHLLILASGITLISYILTYLFSYDKAEIPLIVYYGIIFLTAAYGIPRSAIFAIFWSVVCGFLFYIFPVDGFNIHYHFLLQLIGLICGAILIVFFTDITRECYLQEKQAKERFKVITEKSHEGFITTDKDCKINYTCPSTLSLLGYTEQEFNGMNYYTLIDDDALNEFQRQFNNLTERNEAAINVRHLLKVKDGSRVWIENRITNLLEDEHVNCVVFQLTDVSKLVNEERRQEDYVNIASHELKTPITSLYGYIHLLKARINNSDEDLQKIIKRVEVQAHKMQSIISSMLDNTKIKAGEIQYVMEPFNLNECIRETVDAIKINDSSHNVCCSFESPNRIINGDEEKIARVLTNLISNAVKYSPEGKAIELTTTMEQGQLKVTITDHGIGIAKEKQLQLFQRFYRVDTLPKKLSGLGLGLFIAADIIRHHHGQIGVHSIEGDGSSFWFTLPLIADQI
jgi:PAS domain S-box-containing protein